MKVKKESEKICLKCSKLINTEKDKYVSLDTYDLGKLIEKANFHFTCWVDYFNEKVNNKMKATVQMMQEKAVQLFNSPILKPLLAQVQGSDLAIKMLKTPLTESAPISKEKVILQIQNDRKNRARRSGKTKKRKN